MARGAHARLSGLTVMCALTVSGALSACRSPVGPLPPNAESMSAPAVYERWWAMTEQCSGVSGDLGAVRWYQVPGDVVSYNGREVEGYWSSRGNVIVIAGSSVKSGENVRHEMLHALLRVPGHPRDQFLGSCAGLVDCEDSCIQDAGAWSRPVGTTTVPPDSIVLSIKTQMLAPERDGDRYFALRVDVTNPAAQAVFVDVPPELATPTVFGFDVLGAVGGVSGAQVASDSSRLLLAAQETKEWLYEFVVADKLTTLSLPPGQYFVRGGYLGHWTNGSLVTITR